MQRTAGWYKTFLISFHRNEQHQKRSRPLYAPISDSLVIADERSALLVESNTRTTTPNLEDEGDSSLADPNKGEESEEKGRPVDECVAPLVDKDCPEEPGDGESTGKVALGGAEGVGGSSGLKEEEGEEYKDLGPYTSMVRVGVLAECYERGKDHENGGPTVVEGEWQVNEDLVGNVCSLVMLLDDVIDVGDTRGDEQGEDERWKGVSGLAKL